MLRQHAAFSVSSAGRPGLNYHKPDPPMSAARSLPEWILRTARDPAIAPRTALEADGGAVDYAALARAAAGVAGALAARGLRRGERVGLFAGRTPQAAAGLLGIMAAGAAACVLDPRAPRPALARFAAAAGLRWLLADDGRAVPAAPGIGIVALREALGHAPRTVDDLQPHDDALLLLTSGSAGEPKAVLLTHGNLLANARGVIERTGISPADRLLHAMPLHHTNGINNQLLAPLACGASVVLLQRFRAETYFDALAAWQPTYITGVPTFYLRLLSHAPPREALRRLRFARCGSAPLTESQHRAIEAHLGLPLVVSYGLSEATCTSAMNPPAARRIGSVGTALAGQRIAVLRPGSLDPLPPGAEGEVCIAGPALMKGYATPPDGGGLALTDGWLRTGDLGRLDADGYLTISGRIKDIIVRGGENLSPGAIEAALLAQPAVAACCVVGAPDADLGEVPVAYVVARAGSEAGTEALRGALAERLPRSHLPRRIVLVAALPENAVGKIDRAALRRLAAMD
jgi:acyl-CoA synthetase (AMP-forming)/AMP-acid ligase II